jgi:predicted acyltransferase
MTVTTPSPSGAALDYAAPETVSPTLAEKTGRFVSVDALRGFDMIWILGGEEVVHSLARLFPNRVTQFLSYEFDHAPWEGFHVYDLIFPLFVFIVGVSLVFSLDKLVRTKGRAAAVKRVVVRGVVLYVLGLLYYGGFDKTFDHIRPMGVLQRIALAYLFAGLLYVSLKPRGLALAAAALLLGYWALLTFVPAPGESHASFAEGHNLTNWIDAHYLPGRKWDGDHDPEGLLSTLPAVAGCLLGVFAGLLLKNPGVPPLRKVGLLLLAGAGGVAAGYAWGLQFPIIKKLWTSSFVLLTAGYGAMLLAVFFLVVDVWRWRRWCTPFVWIGMNAITLYLLFELVEFKTLTARLAGGENSDMQRLLGHSWELVSSLVTVGLVLVIARFLYKRQIFLRV